MKKHQVMCAGILCTFFAIHAQAQDYTSEYKRAIEGVLANIQASGAILASPSTVDPNYSFDWVRDSSLTMRSLVRLAYDSKTSPKRANDYLSKINTWINWELKRQMVPKLTDLGEPRFNLDGSDNTDPWGRPQNDGPALRATTAIEIANHWLDEGRFGDVEARLYRAEVPARTLIKRDLEYVAHHWGESSFDLWEEERAMHFYTLVSQKVALIKGAALAVKMNDPAAGKFYQEQADGIDQYLKQFYDANRGIIKFAIQRNAPLSHKTSDLDIAVILAAIQTFDGKFYVDASQAFATLNALGSEFDSLYQINKNKTAASGVKLGIALGRYPQDKYSGFDFSEGNPWFLSTLAMAEFICDLNRVSNQTPFNDAAKAQFNRVIYHMAEGGALTEQFNRDRGYEQGARDLTWSYASYITAYRACNP